jgi:hypothetical protein
MWLAVMVVAFAAAQHMGLTVQLQQQSTVAAVMVTLLLMILLVISVHPQVALALRCTHQW